MNIYENMTAYEAADFIHTEQGTLLHLFRMLEHFYPSVKIVPAVGLYPLSKHALTIIDAKDIVAKANISIHSQFNGVGLNNNGDLVVFI